MALINLFIEHFFNVRQTKNVTSFAAEQVETQIRYSKVNRVVWSCFAVSNKNFLYYIAYVYLLNNIVYNRSRHANLVTCINVCNLRMEKICRIASATCGQILVSQRNANRLAFKNAALNSASISSEMSLLRDCIGPAVFFFSKFNCRLFYSYLKSLIARFILYGIRNKTFCWFIISTILFILAVEVIDCIMRSTVWIFQRNNKF